MDFYDFLDIFIIVLRIYGYFAIFLLTLVLYKTFFVSKYKPNSDFYRRKGKIQYFLYFFVNVEIFNQFLIRNSVITIIKKEKKLINYFKHIFIKKYIYRFFFLI